MAGHRLEGVLGAGWGESAAGRKQRRHQDLIPPDKPCREMARPQRYRHPSSLRLDHISPPEQLPPKCIETGLVRLSTSSDHQIVCR
jgi:hypothetical protein